MPAFASDRRPLEELSKALHGIAELVEEWPADAPGGQHVQIINLRDRFQSIHAALRESADHEKHDLRKALVSMANDLRGAAEDLYQGHAKAPSKGPSSGR